MLNPRTLKILAALVCTFGVLALPAYVGPAFLEPVAGYVVLPPLLSVYLFHKLGVPGLLEHNGACGWGMCAPTAFGWAFLVVFWLGFAWLVAWGLALLTSRRRAG
jgi:hypothetical protein